MHKLTLRDLLDTLITAAVVVPFVGYSARGSMPFVHTPEHMAAVGIAGTALAYAVFGGRTGFGTGPFEWIMFALWLLTVGFGLAALIVQTSWALLVPMVAGLAIIWVLALLHDAGYMAPVHATRHA